jgi:hypothetical protein
MQWVSVSWSKRFLSIAGLAGLLLEAPAMAMPANAGVCDSRGAAEIMLVIDRSGSMSNGVEKLGVPPAGTPTRLATAKLAAVALVDRLAAADRAGLISYSGTTTLDAALGFDRTTLEAAIVGIRTDDDTYAEPAIRLATQELLTTGRESARKIIIHLSDGYSYGNPVAAAGDAKAAGIEFFAIAIGDDPRTLQMQGVEILRQQASDAGHFFHAKTSDAVYDVFDEIGSRIVTQQLDLLSQAYGVKGTGLLSPLNIPLLVNKKRYEYDESKTPALRSAGGAGSTLAVPLKIGTLMFGASVITDQAAGSLAGATSSAEVSSSSRITGLQLRIAGLPVLAAEVIEAKTAASKTGDSYASSGSVLTAKLKVLGLPVTVDIRPNTTVLIPLVGRLILNEQRVQAAAPQSISRYVNFAHLSLTGLLKGELVLAHSFSGVSCEEGLPMFTD